eukprot:scaffold164744_cov35-Tisochrysis_lutea.AAC.2
MGTTLSCASAAWRTLVSRRRNAVKTRNDPVKSNGANTAPTATAPDPEKGMMKSTTRTSKYKSVMEMRHVRSRR